MGRLVFPPLARCCAAVGSGGQVGCGAKSILRKSRQGIPGVAWEIAVGNIA